MRQIPAFVLDRRSVAEAIGAVAAMERDSAVEDVYARGTKLIERAIGHGTTRVRFSLRAFSR